MLFWFKTVFRIFLFSVSMIIYSIIIFLPFLHSKILKILCRSGRNVNIRRNFAPQSVSRVDVHFFKMDGFLYVIRLTLVSTLRINPPPPLSLPLSNIGSNGCRRYHLFREWDAVPSRTIENAFDVSVFCAACSETTAWACSATLTSKLPRN